MANAASNATHVSFTANWNSAQWATGYYLDVAPDISFTAFLPGYNNASVGLVTSVSINGLSSGSVYYYRLRAANAFGTSGNSNPIDALTNDFCGSGTEADPYQITSAAELNRVRNYLGVSYANVHFKLMNDIDLGTYLASTGAGYNGGSFWQPLGYGHFKGVFDGNHHTIASLKINRSEEDYIGLFGSAGYGAIIKNLGVIIGAESSVLGRDYVGGLLGNGEGCTITNCYVNGSVTGNTFIGGLLGFSNSDVSVSLSHTAGSVSGYVWTGGLTGVLRYDSSITDCYSVSSVNGVSGGGGLVGSTFYSTINNSYASGAISATTYAGGLVGETYYSKVNICFWDRDTTGQLQSAGSDDVWGKTTAQMKSITTFSNEGWDFVAEAANGTADIWAMSSAYNNGYPNLVGIHQIQSLETPQNVQATVIGANIRLSWVAVPGANSYKIYQADAPEGPYTEIAFGVSATSWIHILGAAKKFYIVKASTD